ncbi:MAG TPA: hypothetical protein VLF90_00725 [Patescibacteria group bacterium]|nr:hypothetical protein [Patescibacteria group bacterium]
MSKKLSRLLLLLLISLLLASVTIKVSSTVALTDSNYGSSTPPRFLSFLSISRPNTTNDLCAGVGSIFGEYFSTKAGWPVPYSYKNPEDPYCVNLKDRYVHTFYTLAFVVDVLLFVVALLLVWKLPNTIKKSIHRH